MSESHLQPDYAHDPDDMLLIVDSDTDAATVIADATLHLRDANALIDQLTRERDATLVAVRAMCRAVLSPTWVDGMPSPSIVDMVKELCEEISSLVQREEDE